MNKPHLQPSPALLHTLKETGIQSMEELMYADLRAAGWGKNDAFYAAFHHLYADCTRGQQQELLKTIDALPEVKRRATGKKLTEDNIMPTAELAKETSKEKILSDLVLARKRTKEGTKEWADLTKMIGDYAKIKQDDIKTDEQPIRYFLPVRYPTRCEDCLVFQNKNTQGLQNK